MAALENEHLVVNVVYTGPPLAGKTQSVRALMPLLKGRGSEQKVLSPGDWRGRTAFFDWAVYEGGAYEGKSIQCRIISTPGQVALSDRREMLLRSADAVILVIDSQVEALERAVHCYEEMAPWLAESSRDVPVRVVLQCNKQDLPGSLSAEELSRRLGVPCGKDFYPTSASTGKGLRAAFVAGVRNAVERARALVARGLVLDVPEIGSGEELFERMRREVAPIGSAHPAPVGSARSTPSASALSTSALSTSALSTSAAEAPAATSRSAPTARPGSERSSGARGTTRNKAESSRASGGRSSSKAPASGSASSGGASSGGASSGGASSGGAPGSAAPGRTRPAASKAGASSSSLSFGKTKSNSGFYPATGARSARNPERPSPEHPPLPPDHPFAPTRPSTRRPGAGSSRPASSAGPSAAPGASGAIPRPKSSDSAAPASADDKARSARPSRPSPTAPAASSRGSSAASPPASRSTPAGGLPTVAPLRSGRSGGAKAPAPPAESIGARSVAEAKSGTAATRSDTRPSLAAVAARAAADAATARAPAPLESPPSSASLVLPAAGAPGSAPPSSATASAPASSARRAIIPPHSEPGARAFQASSQPSSLAPSTPHPKGWLDPAGAAARAWRPGQGPRPGILPASTYHALVPEELEARRQQLAAAATAAAAEAERRSRTPRRGDASGAERRDVQAKRPAATAPELRSSSAAAGTAAQPSVRPFAEGGPRPAVMPASAYFVALAARARLPGSAADNTAAEHAAAAGGVERTASAGVASESARDRAGAAAAESETAPGAGAAPSGSPRARRPAVMPASAYRASREAEGSVSVGGSDTSAARAPQSVPARAAASLRAGSARQPSGATPLARPHEPAARPAVMPASSYFASLAARAAGPQPPDDASRAANAAAAGDAQPGVTRAPAVTRPVNPDGEASSEARAMSEPTSARARPAVMPASAWRAALAAGEEMPTRARPAHAPSMLEGSGPSKAPVDVQTALGADDDSVDSGWPDAGDVPSLLPASFAAPAQRPHSPRPAVMPASAWRALVERGELPDDGARAARDASASAAPEMSAAGAGGDHRGSEADVEDEWPARPSEGQRRDARGVARSLRLLRGGTPSRRSDEPRATSSRPALTLLERPAVMPARAWQPSGANPPSAAPGATPRRGSMRPAVMPASAWRAALEAAADRAPSSEPSADPRDDSGGSASEVEIQGTDAAGSAAVAWPTPDASSTDASARALGEPAASGATTAPPQGDGEPAAATESADSSASPLPPRAADPSARDGAPLVANDASLGDSPALPSVEAASPSAVDSEGARESRDPQAIGSAGDAPSDPPAQPADGHGANDMPTLAPACDPVLSSERPTIVAGALGEPETGADRSTPLAAFADPATFGLESSRLIEPLADAHFGSGDESSESFRIPETPPGLHAFVAKARLSTPPPPAPPPSDDVIPSLAPSQPELAPGATGSEPHESPEFAGPRMPGHVRAPRAVWRRSTWRTLEMHINSDATALEDARGRWIGELAPGWYARTLRSAPDARSARRAFAEEVLRERRLSAYLSRPRCVALTEEADRFWIWQAACRVPTLAAVLGRRLAARESPSAMAEALLDASLAFVEACQRFIRARVPLPLSLHALSVQDDKLVYSGLLPDPGAAFVHPPNDGNTAFEDALRKKWPGAPVDGSAVFAELSGKAAGRLPEPILAIIRSVVGQSSTETSTNEVSG